MSQPVVRQLFLQNHLGDTVDLLDKTNFAVNLSGLGVEYSSNTVQVNSYINTYNNVTMNKQTVSFTAIFGGIDHNKAYVSFHEFCRKLMKPPLSLRYEIPGVGTFYRNVRVSGISKGEKDKEHGAILANVSLECIEPWKQLRTIYHGARSKNHINTNDYARRTYPYTYPYRYEKENTTSPRVEGNSLWIPYENNLGIEDIKPPVILDFSYYNHLYNKGNNIVLMIQTEVTGTILSQLLIKVPLAGADYANRLYINTDPTDFSIKLWTNQTQEFRDAINILDPLSDASLITSQNGCWLRLFYFKDNNYSVSYPLDIPEAWFTVQTIDYWAVV